MISILWCGQLCPSSMGGDASAFADPADVRAPRGKQRTGAPPSGSPEPRAAKPGFLFPSLSGAPKVTVGWQALPPPPAGPAWSRSDSLPPRPSSSPQLRHSHLSSPPVPPWCDCSERQREKKKTKVAAADAARPQEVRFWSRGQQRVAQWAALERGNPLWHPKPKIVKTGVRPVVMTGHQSASPSPGF